MFEKRQGIYSEVDAALFPYNYMEKIRGEAHLF